MASNGYPHMVFVQPDAGLDKETLAVFLKGLFPDAEVTDKPLRVDVELGGYVFSLWLEEAEGVADRYATYLPEGARRRWLSRCESMIDLHGQPDPDRVHAAQADRIVSALQAEEGIDVFSEETRRFLGMDYGDRTSSAAAAPAPVVAGDAVPAPEAIPPAELAPESVDPLAVGAEAAPVPPPEAPAAPVPAPAPDHVAPEHVAPEHVAPGRAGHGVDASGLGAGTGLE